MSNVLVVYASRHGGTRGIAERIGDVLRSEGLDATVASTDPAPDVGLADAFVIGSGVYMGSWLKEGTEFLVRHQATLATRPTWLFSSGPLRGSIAGKPGSDPLTDALGPGDGPGSGGRKKIGELGAAIGVREHRVFYGAFDPNDPPKALAERLVRMMPGSKSILPPGDFREWDAIEDWAREIARHLNAKVLAAVG
jgi:menaquinone-dependent protoporphyrinogen oxidase